MENIIRSNEEVATITLVLPGISIETACLQRSTRDPNSEENSSHISLSYYDLKK